MIFLYTFFGLIGCMFAWGTVCYSGDFIAAWAKKRGYPDFKALGEMGSLLVTIFWISVLAQVVVSVTRWFSIAGAAA